MVHAFSLYTFVFIFSTSQVGIWYAVQADKEKWELPLSEDDVVYTIPELDETVTHRQRRDNSECPVILNIVLPVSSSDIKFNLVRQNSLYVPGAVVEGTQEGVSTAKPLEQGCFYQGKLLGQQKSYVALSVGQGIMGMFELQGSLYSIQPAPTNSSETNSHFSTKLHAIKLMKTTGYEGLIDDSFVMDLTTSNSRSKRDAEVKPDDKFLEVMVVIDHTVIEFHGEDNTELFILALFNMMNLVYAHSSLGITIRLSLVKIVVLEEEAAEEMWEGEDPRTTLDHFCIWSAVNSLRDRDPGHYDFAMYLSRDRMAPAGYAPVTGMCRPDRSCALIKEDGFSTAFVAAHEIGHTIGLTHDGEGSNKCVNEPKRGSIMAPLVMANLNNYFWSPCSNEEISGIVNSLYCLFDDPFNTNWTELLKPLGRNWDMDAQCKKEFGDGHQLCSTVTHNFNPCEHLWCSTPDNRYLCKTKKAPPLPGSTCGRNRWCFNAQCVVSNPDDPMWKGAETDSLSLKAVDGSWSSWSSWSKCSTSCGKGIKSRTRTCTDPAPALGGSDCKGKSYELRVCDLPEQMKLVCKRFSTLSFSVRRSCMKHRVYYRKCIKTVDDVRAEQCTRYNKRGQTYKPYEPNDANELCLLNCKTEEHNRPLYGKIEALDGTFCSYDDRTSLCYNGKCIDMGCDGKIGSEAKEDMCGVCQGDNTNCTMRQDYFNEKLNKGYQLLVRLYPGTRHFRLKKPDDAYKLVLINTKTNSSLLPDDVDTPLSLVDYGTLWKFSVERSQSLETTGPLQAEYDVIIYSKYSGLRSTLSISFTEPLGIARDGDNMEKATGDPQYEQGKSAGSEYLDKKYVWINSGWGNCSEQCGSGWQDEQFACKNTKLNTIVDEVLCRNEPRPKSDGRACFLKQCVHNYRWVTTEWTKCPDDICTLEKGFNQRRWAFCVKNSPYDDTAWQRVDNSFCKDDKPSLVQNCDASNCTVKGYWITGSWSKCSVTCGQGTQNREVKCVAIDKKKQGKTQCHEKRPSEEETCSKIPCKELKTEVTTTTTRTTTTVPVTEAASTNPATSNTSRKKPSTVERTTVKFSTFTNSEPVSEKSLRLLSTTDAPRDLQTTQSYDPSQEEQVHFEISDTGTDPPELLLNYFDHVASHNTSKEEIKKENIYSTTITTEDATYDSLEFTTGALESTTEGKNTKVVYEYMKPDTLHPEDVTDPLIKPDYMTELTFLVTQPYISTEQEQSTDYQHREKNPETTTPQSLKFTPTTTLDISATKRAATTAFTETVTTLKSMLLTETGFTTQKLTNYNNEQQHNVVTINTSESSENGETTLNTLIASTISNDINKRVDKERKGRKDNCETDSSSICELMDNGKCRLLLFQKLCCVTCSGLNSDQ